MSTIIRQLFRQNINQIKRGQLLPIKRDCLNRRSVSNESVSNLMQGLSPKRRHYLAVGLSFGSATIALLLLNDYYNKNKNKFSQKREPIAATPQILNRSEVPQMIASRIVSNFVFKSLTKLLYFWINSNNNLFAINTFYTFFSMRLSFTTVFISVKAPNVRNVVKVFFKNVLFYFLN
jgi:hypothetical protein